MLHICYFVAKFIVVLIFFRTFRRSNRKYAYFCRYYQCIMRRICLLLITTGLFFAHAFAQEEGENALRKNDWWLGGSLGVTHSLAENATSDDFVKNYPGVELQLGTFVSRVFGFRLSMGVNPQLGRPGQAQREGDPEVYDTHYRFNVLTGYLDGMVDLTTLFTSKRKKYRPSFDVTMFAGGGVLESFHFDHEKVADWTYYPVDAWDKFYWAAHAGLLATYRISPHWDWMLEGSYNITDSRYDGVDSGVALSGYVKLHTGWVYHFNDRTSKQVHLRNELDTSWQPSYTDKDRQRVIRDRERRIEEARKANERIRKERARRIEKSARPIESQATYAKPGVKYDGPGNWFVGIDFGSGMSMAENVKAEDFFSTKVPSGSLQLGRTFNPWVGMRLAAGCYPQFGHPSKVAQKYEPKVYSSYAFYSATGTLDMLLNVTNMCRKYDERNWFDANLVLGGGALYSFGFDKKVKTWDEQIYPVDDNELLTWVAKVGLMGSWHVAEAIDLNTEFDVFATDNAYNGVIDSSNRPVDFFSSIRIGFTYFFGNKKGRHRLGNTPLEHRYWKNL